MQEEPPLVVPRSKLAAPDLAPMSRPGVAGVAAALLVGLGVFGFAGSEEGIKGDRISNSQAAKLADGFGRAHGSLLPVDLSTGPQRDRLAQSLPMSSAEAERLLALVERGERMLGWLTLWDNFDEDGDIASVTAAGFTQTVALMHAPKRILVPYVPGQPVLITGERDGMGGGITLAIELSTGPLPLPPLAVGQTIALPIQ
jgi:hypothetical protein